MRPAVTCFDSETPMTPQNIPAELRRRPQWVCWRYEGRDGKHTKAPINPKSNGKLSHAKTNDPATWTDFEAALAAYGTYQLNGVGFCFAADDGLTGIDMDHVLDPESGELRLEAAEILQRFAGTYAEISPSGTGLRLFCYGKPRRSGKNTGKMKWLEVYAHPSSRYLTVTGNAWNGNAAEVTDQQAALDWLHERFMQSTEHTPVDSKPVPVAALNLDDAALLAKARAAKNGAEFDRLWSGDASGHGNDHSAADLALCNLLAFWTGNDAARMDRLFRQSGLMRLKWNEKRGEVTYGQLTTAKAIESTRETHRAKTRNGNRPYSKPPSQPSKPSQGDYHVDIEVNNSSKSGTDGDFEAVPAVPGCPETVPAGPLRPYYFMQKEDRTRLSKQSDLPEWPEIVAAGLYYVPVVQEKDGKNTQSKHGAPVWISIPFELLATTDDGQGHGHGVALRFDSIHGHRHTWTLPRALLVMEGRELFQKLYDMGFHMSVTDNAFHRLRDYLNRARSEVKDMAKALSVARTGWAPGRRFVLPDAVFGGDDSILFYQSDDPRPSPYICTGTLEDWRDGVSKPIAPYDLPVFALSCAFAGPLLEPLRIESGGFHFEGLTSTGKTSAQRFALSVWGDPRELLQTWNGTRVGVELVTAAYSDTLLVLDEIGQADPKAVGEIVYLICNENGRTRGNVRLTHRANLRWRTLLLSSGEKSLAQVMAGAGGFPPAAGQETRLAHLPVDVDGCGIFNDLKQPDQRKALLASIAQAAKRNYGWGARAFLNRLTAPDGLPDPDEAAAAVKEMATRMGGTDSTNEIDRVALRFALVGFAGELATRWNITGWPNGRALEAATMMFRRWKAHWGAASRDETLFLLRCNEWLSEHQTGSFAEIDPITKILDRQTALRMASLRPFYGYTSLKDERRTFYLNPAGWKDLTKQTGRGVALSALKRTHRLEGGGDGDGGQRERINGERQRFYIIHEDAD